MRPETQATKQMVRQIEEAERAISDEPRQKTGKKGRPKSGEAEASRRTGVPRTTARDAKAHVAAAENYRPFQDPNRRLCGIIQEGVYNAA